MAILACFATLLEASAASALLEWDQSPNEDVVAYDIYMGQQSGMYYAVIYAPNTNRIRVDNLVPGKDYYFAAKAVTSAGLESSFSNEVWFSPVATQRPGSMLTLSRNTDGSFVLTGSGIPYDEVIIESSEDLLNWSQRDTVTTSDDGVFFFVDHAEEANERFYRIKAP